MASEASEFGSEPNFLGFRRMSYREKGMYEEAIAELRNPATAKTSPTWLTWATPMHERGRWEKPGSAFES
jgi:hypothetical protein